MDEIVNQKEFEQLVNEEEGRRIVELEQKANEIVSESENSQYDTQTKQARIQNLLTEGDPSYIPANLGTSNNREKTAVTTSSNSRYKNRF
jgi:hypothetical protein